MIPYQKSISKKQIALVITDLVVLASVPFITIYIYFFIKMGFTFKIQLFALEKTAYFFNLLIFMVTFYIMDLYDFKKDFRNPREIGNIIVSLAMGCSVSILVFYLIGKPPLGRGIFLVYSGTLFFLITGYRWLYSKIAVMGIYRKKAIIVGAGKGGQAVASLIKTIPQSDLEIFRFLDIDRKKKGLCVGNTPVDCQSESLIDAVKENKPDLLILAMRSSRYDKMIKDLIWCSQQGIEIKDMVSIYEELTGKIPLKYINDRWLFYSYLNQPKLYFIRIKKLLEFILSSIIIVVFAPIMLITALAIKLDSKGPVFFCQQRVGKDERHFNLIKFRSMIQNAEEGCPVWAKKNDPRITNVGKIIRLLRFDELPQLFNVLQGDMSLVGPRPERPEFVSSFLGKSKNKNAIIPFYKERLSVKPGITGWAQVMYPYASSWEESLKKLEYDLYYIKNMSFFLDLRILLKTIRVAIFGYGAK